jgi:osmotically-inducible protein OsmY
MPTYRVAAAALAAAALFLAGCSQKTIDSAETDTHNDLTAARAESNKIEQKIEPDAQKLGLGARVTAALYANANLPHTIRVDAAPHSVTLKGSVRTSAQKALAAAVAKDTVPAGDSVTNDLTITP